MPEKISVISIPGEKNDVVYKILDILNKNVMFKEMMINLHDDFETKVELLLNAVKTQLKVEKEDCEKAVLYLEGKANGNEGAAHNPSPSLLRAKEFEKLQDSCESEYLKVIREWSNDDEDAHLFAYKYLPYFKKINRVTKLRETTALEGFRRLSRTSDNAQIDVSTRNYDLMYHKKIPDSQKWLPAYTVFGEGIFIQLNLEQIEQWESNEKVQAYFERFKERIKRQPYKLAEIVLAPRNIMIHTLAHFLIEEIANISGYNTASIRERMYLNPNQAAVLIYTSAGDMEGTFGGLVRLGRKNKFFPLLDKAIANSQWCSSDPVCTELGFYQGQGIDNVNGAACYNCCYLPETSCEIGNMYLDRTLLSHPEIGFFKNLSK